jgi:hypothetical protein
VQHGKPQCVIGPDDQPDAREGQAGRDGVAERFVVPLAQASLICTPLSCSRRPITRQSGFGQSGRSSVGYSVNPKEFKHRFVER